MSTDQARRLRQGVREIADAVPVPEIGPASLRAAAASRTRRPRRAPALLLPALAAAATLLIVAVIAVLPGAFDRDDARPSADGNGAVLPATLAGESHPTAGVSAAPTGPA